MRCKRGYSRSVFSLANFLSFSRYISSSDTGVFLMRTRMGRMGMNSMELLMVTPKSLRCRRYGSLSSRFFIVPNLPGLFASPTPRDGQAIDHFYSVGASF